MMGGSAPPEIVTVRIPGLRSGSYAVTVWDTKAGGEVAKFTIEHTGGGELKLDTPPAATDVAFALRRAGGNI